MFGADVIFLDDTRLKTAHVIYEITNHSAVMKRLRQTHEHFDRQELNRDPFRCTILETMRASVEHGDLTRQHWIRAKLRWFAQTSTRGEEMKKVVDNYRQVHSTHGLVNDFDGYDYSPGPFEPAPSNSLYEVLDEYSALLKNVQSPNLPDEGLMKAEQNEALFVQSDQLAMDSILSTANLRTENESARDDELYSRSEVERCQSFLPVIDKAKSLENSDQTESIATMASCVQDNGDSLGSLEDLMMMRRFTTTF